MFLWNFYHMQPLAQVMKAEASKWMVPITHGFFAQSCMSSCITIYISFIYLFAFPPHDPLDTFVLFLLSNPGFNINEQTYVISNHFLPEAKVCIHQIHRYIFISFPSLRLTLISRRSRHYAGTRYLYSLSLSPMFSSLTMFGL